jgi:hypothetical protein
MRKAIVMTNIALAGCLVVSISFLSAARPPREPARRAVAPRFGVRITDCAGIVGDYNTDCQPAWQDLIDKSPNGTRFTIPAGRYRVGRTLDFSRLGNWSMEGEGSQNSILVSADAGKGPVVKSVNNIFDVRDVAFVGNLTTGGTGFYSENTQSCSFTNCRFAGGVGMDARDPFMTNWHHCQFNGQNGRKQDNGSKIGLQIFGSTACSVTGSCDFTGWNEGLRAAGAGVSVHAARFEVCGIGMRLGCDTKGNPYGLSGSSFAGISGEANDTYIRCQVCGSCTFSSIGGQGSPNSPSGGSVYGWDIQTAHGCTFQSLNFGGTASKAALFLRDSEENKNLAFQGCEIANDTGKVWDLPSPALKDVVFLACNNPKGP